MTIEEMDKVGAELLARLKIQEPMSWPAGFCQDLRTSENLISEMDRLGFWCEELSPRHFENEYWTKNGVRGQFKAIFHRHHSNGMRGYAYGETRPAARAKAALMTLRHEAGIYEEVPDEPPKCATCGFVMCEQFDERPVTPLASICIPNGKFWCYHCKTSKVLVSKTAEVRDGE